MTVDTNERADLIMLALTHAMDRNGREATQILARIGDNSDNADMYGVCRALASAVEQVLPRIFGALVPDTIWAFQVLGDAPDPAQLFAARFIIANANHDIPTCVALFRAAAEAGSAEYTDSIAALLGMAGALLRDAEQRRKVPGMTTITTPATRMHPKPPVESAPGH
jgi:hypothetical protein